MKSIIIGSLLTIEAMLVTSRKIKTYQVVASTFSITGIILILVIHAPEF
jgi:predicted membrane channel-forming protein YqfA (hemolysin III family)